MKANKTLIVFAVIYNAVILFAILTFPPLAFVMLAPVFFLIAIIALSVLWYHKIIQISTSLDKILFLFSTPIPLTAIGFLSFL